MLSNTLSDYSAHPETIFWQGMVPRFLPAHIASVGHNEAEPDQSVAATPEILWWFDYVPGQIVLGA